MACKAKDADGFSAAFNDMISGLRFTISWKPIAACQIVCIALVPFATAN